MARQTPKPCKTCRWWLPISASSGVLGGCCCHVLLKTGQRNGMNEDKTDCSTYKKRKRYKAMTVRK